MLVAIDESGNRILGDAAERGKTYYCPECHAPVILKRGAVKIPHFAHAPDAHCEYGRGEGMRHLLLKWHVGQLFSRNQVDFEVKLLANRRADVVVHLGGTPFVVECQDSRLPVREWIFRTLDYSRAGYPILWIWSLERLNRNIKQTRELFDALLDYNGIPKELRYAHDKLGEIYLMDSEGALARCRFELEFNGLLNARARLVPIPQVREVEYKAFRPKGWRYKLQTVRLWR